MAAVRRLIVPKIVLCGGLFAASVATAQIPGVLPPPPARFGTVDPCAGTGATGSSSYGACQLREHTLRRGTARAPDLSAVDQTNRFSIEQACVANAARGADVHAVCLRRQLAARGQDPTAPVRRIPETQRKPNVTSGR